MSESRRERIERLINEHDLKLKVISLRAGKGETFVRDMLRRGRSPSEENLTAVEHAVEDLIAEAGSVPTERRTGIPNLLINAGMGNGGLESIEIASDGAPLPAYTDGQWSLPSGIQHRLGKTKGVYALPVEGDSMMPGIAGGSVVFVDTNRVQPSPPGIFVVDFGDGLLVKRVELIGGTDQISIISDNPAYRDYEFARDDVTIWGRVVALYGWLD